MAAPAVTAEVRQTPHEILGVEVGTSVEELRRVYRAHIKSCHPDKQPQGATEAQNAAAKKKFIEVHAAWESLEKNGFQEREPNWEEEEGKDDMEKMLERMTNLRECNDFADEQRSILESAVGYFVESVPRKPVPVKELRKQKRLSIVGGSKKSVIADLKRGLGPQETFYNISGELKELPIPVVNDDLLFLRRLTACSYANSLAIKEEMAELEAEIALQAQELGRHVVREDEKRIQAEKKAAAAAAGAREFALAEAQLELEDIPQVPVPRLMMQDVQVPVPAAIPQQAVVQVPVHQVATPLERLVSVVTEAFFIWDFE